MSSISDVSSLTSQIQQPTQTTQAKRHGHHHGAGGAGGNFQAAFGAAAQAVGVDPSKVGDLQKQIDQAAQGARKNAGSGDPRQAVQTAIDNVLKNNGIDPTKFQDALKAQFSKTRTQNGQTNPAAPTPTTPNTFGGDTDGDGDHSPTAASGQLDTTA